MNDFTFLDINILDKSLYLCYSFCVEYDKKILSLYTFKGNAPKAFVTITKRAEKIYILLSLKIVKTGVLFVFSSDKIFFVTNINVNQEVLLKDNFNFEDDYFIAFYGEEDKLFSKNLLDASYCAIMEKFENLFNEICLRRREEQAKQQDRNFIVDSITSKMFGFLPLGFYSLSKNQLYSLFSTQNRAENIEKIIPCSRFIKSGEGNDEIYAGVVYKNNVPYAVAIGFKSGSKINKPVHESSYQYFYQKENEKEGYFLSFRRASDGDIVWI